MKARGLNEAFLHPKYENLTDPFVFPEMDQAVKRLQRAVEKSEKILIYGDYDADGITASTLMADVLSLIGVPPDHFDIMLPDRFKDGYGMSHRLVERAKAAKTSLVITVDCGSRNHDIIDQLRQQGTDTIVTDHHECGETLPEAVAVLNPKRSDFPEEYRYLRDLAGVGVAFKLAQALVKRGMIPNGQEKWLLDLVLIGTICDSMPLTGENRILGFYGMKVLPKTRRLGLRELMRTAGIQSLTSDAIGFQLGPRLNAAGRLKSADLSLQLLRTKSAPEAAALATQLEDLNLRRKTAQRLAISEISERGASSTPVMVETGSWHEGVLGIIAGRLVEKYQRPAFVLTESEPGILKGSARSFGDFDLAAALNKVQDLLIAGGGHAAAAGLRLATKNLDSFTQSINQYYQDLNLSDQTDLLRPHADLAVSDLAYISLDLLDHLSLLEPFGEGNQTPLFRLQNIHIESVTPLGADKNHLRLDVADSSGQRLKLLSFFAPKKWFSLTPDTPIEPLIQLEKNEFRGVASPEGRIVDLAVLPTEF